MGLQNLKLDLCIWTLNSYPTLEKCLSSIDAALPAEKVCCKIAVQGVPRNMVDGEVTSVPWRAESFLKDQEILKRHGWTTYCSSAGIARQANVAMSHVDTPFFATFEHDIILNPNWLRSMTKLYQSSASGSKSPVACVQGVRNTIGSRSMQAIENWYWSRRKKGWFQVYPSMDNNLFDTKIIRSLGGFPTDCAVSVDNHLRDKAIRNGYRWLFDSDCLSGHIRTSFLSYQSHLVRQLTQTEYFWQHPGVTWSDRVRNFAFSPLAALRALKGTRVPTVFPTYLFETYLIFLLSCVLRHKSRDILISP